MKEFWEFLGIESEVIRERSKFRTLIENEVIRTRNEKIRGREKFGHTGLKKAVLNK